MRDILFPKPKTKSYYECEREKEMLFDRKLQNFTFDENIIARTSPRLIYHIDNICDENERRYNCDEEIKRRAASRQEIFKTDYAEIWCYDKDCEEWDREKKKYTPYVGKQLAFRLGNEVIALTFAVKDIYKDKISFPAMCMAYMDCKGNRLPFTIRDKFIEQGLGLLQHGEYRLGKIKKDTKFMFCNMSTTLEKIIGFLKEEL